MTQGRRGENLHATSHVLRATTYIFGVLCFALFYVIQEKRKKNMTFILNQSLILSSVCVIIVTRLVGGESELR